MASRIFLGFLLILSLFTGHHCYAQERWTTTLASVTFKIKNAGLTVEGSLKGFTGELLFDANALTHSQLSGSVQVATINTGINKRDEHLKSPDYFDVNKYKTIQLKSKTIYRKNEDFSGIFDLTIKNITRQVEIPFNFKQTGNKAVFEGNFLIDRRDFGVGGNSFILGDKVTISIIVNAYK